jgi:TetR/AcrR family transcriptional repressor of nem operon
MRAVKQPRAIKTRDRILQETVRMYALKGFHDSTVGNVIEAAQVTSGAFFYHFKSKEDLGLAVVDHYMEQRCRELDRIEKKLPEVADDDPLGKAFRRLDAVCERIVQRRNKKGGCLIGNLSIALSDTHPAFRNRLGECFDEMAAEFQVHLDEAAADRNLSGDLDTREMARYVVSVIEGAIMLSRTHRDLSVVERQVRHLKDDLRQSFQAAEARRRCPDLENPITE